ncbi:MAG TPA: hypothetical protein VHM90_20805 [Phycisphaerae bacterium]|nr:hypothetical protein [Phycisphaerae bacterium]
MLLYLSPGFDETDVAAADDAAVQARSAELRKGFQPLPGPDDYFARWKWWAPRTKVFGAWETLRSSIAVLNIGAYHSKDFVDEPLLAALPSSRVSLDWAQDVLFPQAIAGQRTVVCMRSRRFWGLDKATRHGKALYAPSVTRGGFMVSGAERDEIVTAVKAAIVARRPS